VPRKPTLIASRQSLSAVTGTDADLKGLAVGVVRGNSDGKELDAQAGFTRTEANDQEQLVRMLVSKRFDGARKQGVAQQIQTQPFLVQSAPLYVAFSKAKGAAATDWAVKFSRVLAQMKADGFTDKVLET